jgi:fimbrial chaperone protein
MSARTVWVALAAALAWIAPKPARAAAFDIKPTQLNLSPKAKSASLTIHNESAAVLRFQMSVFTWAQSAKGEMQLQPTQDIVFFPTLLQLAPGEERAIRVGSQVPSGPLERSYRIFIEELPPPPAGKAKDAKPGKTEIRVLTRMGVPIFVAPAGGTGAAPVGRVEPKAARGEKVSFEVKNTSPVHFTIKKARVVGRGAGNENLFERSVPGWYVLAGGSRVFEVDAPKGVCAKTKALAFEVETDKTTLGAELPTASGICGP